MKNALHPLAHHSDGVLWVVECHGIWEDKANVLHELVDSMVTGVSGEVHGTRNTEFTRTSLHPLESPRADEKRD